MSVPKRQRWIDNFLAGILVLTPAWITYLVVKFVMAWANRTVGPIIHLADPYLTSAWAYNLARVGAVLLLLVVVSLLGWGTRILLVRRAFGWFEQLITRLPMVGRVYASAREIVQSIFGRDKTAFRRVVMIEWPRPGVRSIGFVTSSVRGEVKSKSDEGTVYVFVPTTPNPTSGYMMIVPERELIPLSMSVDEGLRLVVSGGLAGSSAMAAEAK